MNKQGMHTCTVLVTAHMSINHYGKTGRQIHVHWQPEQVMFLPAANICINAQKRDNQMQGGADHPTHASCSGFTLYIVARSSTAQI